MKYFIAAYRKGKTIYIKVDEVIHEKLFNVLHDFGFTMSRTVPNKWDYNIELGLSFEIDTEEEIASFVEFNNKVNPRVHAI